MSSWAVFSSSWCLIYSSVNSFTAALCVQWYGSVLYNSSPSARNHCPGLQWDLGNVWALLKEIIFFPLSASVPVFIHLLDFTDCLLSLQNFPRQRKLTVQLFLSVSSFQYHCQRIMTHRTVWKIPIYMLSKVFLCLIIRMSCKNSPDLETSGLDLCCWWS